MKAGRTLDWCRDRVIYSLTAGARRASPLQRRGVGAGHARPEVLSNK